MKKLKTTIKRSIIALTAGFILATSPIANRAMEVLGYTEQLICIEPFDFERPVVKNPPPKE